MALNYFIQIGNSDGSSCYQSGVTVPVEVRTGATQSEIDALAALAEADIGNILSSVTSADSSMELEEWWVADDHGIVHETHTTLT